MSGGLPPHLSRWLGLVVDDDPVMRILLANRLGKNGCHAHVAASVAEALSLLTKNIYDLILLDGHLRDGSGATVAQWVRAEVRHRRTPIVAISSDDTPAHVERLIGAGANRFIPKPISAEQVRSAVRSYCTSGRRDGT